MDRIPGFNPGPMPPTVPWQGGLSDKPTRSRKRPWIKSRDTGASPARPRPRLAPGRRGMDLIWIVSLDLIQGPCRRRFHGKAISRTSRHARGSGPGLNPGIREVSSARPRPRLAPGRRGMDLIWIVSLDLIQGPCRRRFHGKAISRTSRHARGSGPGLNPGIREVSSARSRPHRAPGRRGIWMVKKP